MKKILLFGWISLTIFLSIIAVNLFNKPAEPVSASVAFGNEYQSTTTSPMNGSIVNVTVLKNSPGTLGNINITGSGAGFVIYDATTTNVNLRAASMSTSSLEILAAFPNLPTVGSYVYDSVALYGILLDKSSGSTVGTTTIMFR